MILGLLSAAYPDVDNPLHVYVCVVIIFGLKINIVHHESFMQ